MKVFGALWELRFDLWAYAKQQYKPRRKQTNKNTQIVFVILCGEGKLMLEQLPVFWGKEGWSIENMDLSICYSDAVNSQ